VQTAALWGQDVLQADSRKEAERTCRVQVIGKLARVLLEQDLQIGCQLEDKVLRYAVPDESARSWR